MVNMSCSNNKIPKHYKTKGRHVHETGIIQSIEEHNYIKLTKIFPKSKGVHSCGNFFCFYIITYQKNTYFH